ncbi:MAG: hypothetical protein F6K17_30420 [Okeania sp. SIO3C4]|nr:hypothetical protein [Okeania sp. SIO3C4]
MQIQQGVCYQLSVKSDRSFLRQKWRSPPVLIPNKDGWFIMANSFVA